MTFDDMTVHSGPYGVRFESWEGDQGRTQIQSVPTANAPFPIVVTQKFPQPKDQNRLGW